jgi:hypothetical protein
LKTAELASRRKQGALLQIRRRDHDDLAKRPRTLVGHDKFADKLQTDINELKAALARRTSTKP